MTPTYDAILDVVCDPSLGSEEKAAKILALVEKPKKPARKRESFDGEQLRAVMRAMSDGRWHRLDEICFAAGYPPSSIGAINARIRELPQIGVRYEKRKARGSRLTEYRLFSPLPRVNLVPKQGHLMPSGAGIVVGASVDPNSESIVRKNLDDSPGPLRG